MTRGVKQYRPSSELKDHHDLIRIAAGIRTNDRRPAALKRKMTQHVTELLKLFACDPTLGVRDPAIEEDERRRREEKRIRAEQAARSRQLEEQVRAAEAAAEASGGVPDYSAPPRRSTVVEMMTDVRRFAEGSASFDEVYGAHGLSLRAMRVLAGMGDIPTSLRSVAVAAGRRKTTEEIRKAFADRGVILPDGATMNGERT